MKIAFLGDCVIQTSERHTLGSNLEAILNRCDIQAINFEAPVYFEGATGIDKSGPIIHQSEKTPGWLESKGFNVISFANNHMYDLQDEGLRRTESLFQKSTIVGYGDYHSAHGAKIVGFGGEKIGFIGLTHKEFGCVDFLSPSKIGTADISSPKVFIELESAKRKCDHVFILAHAGVEYQDYPLPKWRELYRSFIDMGASGVIASHPHVPQGFEIYKGKPIFYSLGNFAFEKPQVFLYPQYWNSSLLVFVDTDLESFQWYPIQYDTVSKEIEIDASEDLKRHITSISGILKDEKSYDQAVRNIISSLVPSYQNMAMWGGLKAPSLTRMLKEFIKPLFGKKRMSKQWVHALNLFQCESHRWIMEEILKNGKY